MAIKKSEIKLQMREEAKRKIHGGNTGVTGARDYRERVEKGRQLLMQKAAEGGDSRGKRVKAELTYLLNNYMPSYDAKIQSLIDDWRRSGDPSYDPGIRVQWRRAVQEHMKKSPF